MLQVFYNSIIALLKSNKWCWYNVRKWPTPWTAVVGKNLGNLD
jgi:hypothetical protein